MFTGKVPIRSDHISFTVLTSAETIHTPKNRESTEVDFILHHLPSSEPSVSEKSCHFCLVFRDKVSQENQTSLDLEFGTHL